MHTTSICGGNEKIIHSNGTCSKATFLKDSMESPKTNSFQNLRGYNKKEVLRNLPINGNLFLQECLGYLTNNDLKLI